MLKYKFEIGEKVRLDADYQNTSIVEVVLQSPKLSITAVKSDGQIWEVLTGRLSRILNEDKNDRRKEGEMKP